MAIPASTVVSVNISTTPQFPSRRGFGVLNILGTTPNVIPPIERIRYYTSLTEVAVDFPEGTPEFSMAAAYFAQQPRPVECAISTQYTTDQPAQLWGGSAETNVTVWNAITDGSFAITIDGVSADVLTLNFSAAIDLPAVAAIIEAGIQAADLSAGFTAATVVYSNGRFLISSGTIGATSTITVTSAAASGTNITDLMATGVGVGITQDGFVAEPDPVDALQPILDKSSDWYGFALDNIYSATQIQAVAAAIEPLVNIMCYATQDVTVLDANSTTDIASLLKAADYRRTFGMYDPNPASYPHCSAFGRLFTTDFGGIDTTITLKFKQLPGITPVALTTAQKSVTADKNINVYTTIGNTEMLAEGVMASGTFTDEVQGVDWLTSAIETNVFGYLATRTTKVPLTDKGGAALEQQVIRALDEGITNGLLAPGETIDGVFLANGYAVTVQPVAEIPQTDIDNRVGPTITFVALLAGAVHFVQINGTLER